MDSMANRIVRDKSKKKNMLLGVIFQLQIFSHTSKILVYMCMLSKFKKKKKKTPKWNHLLYILCDGKKKKKNNVSVK